MIRYALRCDKDHAFEGWFRSGADYDKLAAAKGVSCTICGSVKVEKAIMMADLGLNPATAGNVIRVPMPPLTEETRRNYIKQARAEAENARVAIRSIRRDANGDLKSLLKDKEINEDEERRGEEEIQKLTDKHVADIDRLLETKEHDLMQV